MLFIIIFQYARAVDTYSLFVHCGVQGWYIFSECFSWCAQVTIVCTCLRVYAHTLQKCDSWAFAYNDTAPMRWWICPTRKINCLLPVLNTYEYAHCLICGVLFLEWCICANSMCAFLYVVMCGVCMFYVCICACISVNILTLRNCFPSMDSPPVFLYAQPEYGDQFSIVYMPRTKHTRAIQLKSP